MDPFAALSDPTRRHIIEMLARGGAMPAGRIADAFPSARPTISRHLKVLRDAGLVKVNAVAQERRYALSPCELAKVEEWIARHRRFWEEALSKLQRFVESDHE
jgi:DNA-binding transcriptional ArsR family regulator